MTLGEIHQSSPLTIHGGTIAAVMDAQLGMTALSYAVTKEAFAPQLSSKPILQMLQNMEMRFMARRN